jgi:hypothetical protein
VRLSTHSPHPIIALFKEFSRLIPAKASINKTKQK